MKIQARSVSLIAKAVASAMIFTTFIKVVFFTAGVSIMGIVMGVLVLCGAVLLVFSDISLNILVDKLTGGRLSGQLPASPEETPAQKLDPKGEGL